MNNDANTADPRPVFSPKAPKKNRYSVLDSRGRYHGSVHRHVVTVLCGREGFPAAAPREVWSTTVRTLDGFETADGFASRAAAARHVLTNSFVTQQEVAAGFERLVVGA